ncbi:MAG: hypothetical protein ACI9F9_002195 [Candidatus Paceibacteria bacterium]|jgi:hypothetical protein
MDPTQIIFGGVVAPALVAGLILTLACKVWSKEPQQTTGAWAGAPALCAAFVVGFILLLGEPASVGPDSDRTPTGLDWIFWISLPCALFLPLSPRQGLWAQLIRLIVGVTLIRYVLRSQFESNWSYAEGWQWLAGLSALFLGLWAALERLTSRPPPASSPIILWTLTTSLAVLAAMTGSAKIGQLGGTVAAGLGAAQILSWRKPGFNLAGSGTAMVLTLVFGLGLNAYFYSYTPGVDILLLASAPFLALLTELPAMRKLKPGRRTLVTYSLFALPIAVALTRAGIELLNASDEYDY